MSACVTAGKTESPPIPEEAMSEILYEVQLMGAWVDRKGGPLMRREQMRHEMTDEVLARHNMSRQEFHDAYQFYLDHPVQLDTMYQRIKRRMEQELDSVRLAAKSKPVKPKSTSRNPSVPSEETDSLPSEKNLPGLIKRKTKAVSDTAASDT